LEAPHLERKLVAIFAADVEGFSRHMEHNEGATLEVLSAHRVIIDGSIQGHGGRITGTAGDSVLAEFSSVLAAVECAVEIQNRLADENAKLDPERALLLRIGINVGDVMVKEGDIFGDGVNIAARLENIAEPGGICMSDDAYRQIRGKVDMTFEDMGSQTLKNIAEPMRVWRLRIGGESAPVSHQSSAPVGPHQLPALLGKPSVACCRFRI
jgi:adenylate cyclase